MTNPLAKTPFLLLLASLAFGILIQHCFGVSPLGFIFTAFGVAIILVSYWLPDRHKYRMRWLFGSGIFVVFAGIGIFLTDISQQKSEFVFYNEKQVYKGVVIDIPQKKPRSTAYKVHLPDWDKQIVCYFQPDSLKEELNPGDEFIFEGRIQPFRNAVNLNDFDYVSYMSNQGYAGWVYVLSDSRMPTGNEVITLKTKAQYLRARIIRFYQQLGFNETQYTILAALTLGYQEALSDDIKQSFRATGTAHVLSVSGLHVGIIYAVLSFLLSFIKRTSRGYRIKPVLIIILLWLYAFITGLPPSVIRAAAMLTVFCLSEIFNRNSFTLNGLYIAAFFMLLFRPLWLFDVSFQLSFISVLAILYLHPKAVSLINLKNNVLRYVWQMFTLSVVAQLGTFPLCLYYFGTFPTYFFISNMLVVPLVTFITYAAMSIVLAKLLTYILPGLGYYIFYLPLKILQGLVDILTSVISFFEKLPYAVISDVHISGINLLLLSLFIICTLIFLIYKKSKAVVIALSTVLIMLSLHFYSNISKEPDRLIVYRRSDTAELKWFVDGQEYFLKYANTDTLNQVYRIKDKSLLVLRSNEFKGKQIASQFKADIIILSKGGSYSISDIKNAFATQFIILDSSLPDASSRRLVKESQKHNITCYQVTQDGAFTLDF